MTPTNAIRNQKLIQQKQSSQQLQHNELTKLLATNDQQQGSQQHKTQQLQEQGSQQQSITTKIEQPATTEHKIAAQKQSSAITACSGSLEHLTVS